MWPASTTFSARELIVACHAPLWIGVAVGEATVGFHEQDTRRQKECAARCHSFPL